MEVLNKGRPIRGWPAQRNAKAPAALPLASTRQREDRTAKEKQVTKVIAHVGRDRPLTVPPGAESNKSLGVRFIRAPGVMKRLPRGEPRMRSGIYSEIRTVGETKEHRKSLKVLKDDAKMIQRSPDLERMWKTLILNHIVRPGEGRAGPSAAC